MKSLGLSTLALLLLAGCSSGSGGGGSPAPTPGVLEPGGAGIAITKADDGTNTGVLVDPTLTTASDINDNLQVVGSAELTAGAPFTAALWNVDPAGTTPVPAALAPIAPGAFASAYAIDEAGSPVGQADDGDRLVAVLWKNGTGAPTVLPELAPHDPVDPIVRDYAAYAISPDGTVIAGEAIDVVGISRAVIWVADGNGDFLTAPTVLPQGAFTTGLGPSLFASARSVARVGLEEILVVGEAEDGDGDTHAALWRSTDSGAIFAATDLGLDRLANGVNSQRLVVGEANIRPTANPVSWAVSDTGVAGAAVSLAAAGSALAVNEDGRIAGSSGAPALATVWTGTTPVPFYGAPSEAFNLNNSVQPYVVGRSGNFGFVKRVQ
jgi:uncharacterized membrane protein